VEKEQVALQVIGDYPEDVRLIYHPLPHGERSEMIAEGLEAAGAQGKFWELHDRLLEGVPQDIDELRVAAEDVGLDMAQFDQALKTGQYTAVVTEAIELAKDHGVEDLGLFINGIEYNKYYETLDDLKGDLEKVIDAGLAAAEESSKG